MILHLDLDLDFGYNFYILNLKTYINYILTLIKTTMNINAKSIKKNSNSNHNQHNQQNQISGIEPNYSYNGVQGLPFDQSSISSSGYNTQAQLANAVKEQQQFVNNYNNYKPISTFDKVESNSSNLENLTNFSRYNINDGFQPNQPIQLMPNTINKHETLYDNLGENLLRDSIKEYRLNIDSSDRNIELYPDPFNYVVHLGPVTNSGINASVSRTNVKNELKNLSKKNKIIKSKNHGYNDDLNYLEAQYDSGLSNNTILDEDKIFVFDNPEAIKQYTINLENSSNPNIIRDFVNVSYVRLDCAVVPKYNTIAVNKCWDFCRKKHHKKTYFRDEYDRIKDSIILNDRYIPDDTNEYNPLGDRFVQIYIKELQSIRNFGTNSITDKSFLLVYDKTLGALYLKLIPYSATKTYKESLLGNLTRLSIQFYNSWGDPLTINTEPINYEKNQLEKTILIDPFKYNIENLTSISFTHIKSTIKNINEIIKCFIVINHNIELIIPFYTPNNYVDNSSIKFHEECFENLPFYTNEQIFEIKNLYLEFDSFVFSDNSNSFEQRVKITKNNKKVKLSVDEFINNVLWFNFDEKFIDKIIQNIKSFDHNYRNFGFAILDKLKTELVNIPTNKNFQNFLTFLVGVWENELNTKIDYTN